ncbi:hypothetical protein [Altererythrobacter fulvus]|uniref:hypothetical protein n=1 Tax=Caenibius fulvus TaxID=2126012 RepID=UPI0030191704
MEENELLKTRHAELVSASIFPNRLLDDPEKWILKRVQDDDSSKTHTQLKIRKPAPG